MSDRVILLFLWILGPLVWDLCSKVPPKVPERISTFKNVSTLFETIPTMFFFSFYDVLTYPDGFFDFSIFLLFFFFFSLLGPLALAQGDLWFFDLNEKKSEKTNSSCYKQKYRPDTGTYPPAQTAIVMN